jgi:hypothetical protein
VGRQLGPEHIHSQAFFFFVLPSLLHFMLVPFYFTFPLFPETNPVLIFLKPAFLDVTAFFLVLAKFDVPVLTNAFSNIWIQGMLQVLNTDAKTMSEIAAVMIAIDTVRM